MKRRHKKSVAAQRVQHVIEGDRLHLPADYLSLIGYDAEKLLGDYFELNESPVIEVGGREGKYTVSITATAVRARPVRTLGKI